MLSRHGVVAGLRTSYFCSQDSKNTSTNRPPATTEVCCAVESHRCLCHVPNQPAVLREGHRRVIG